MGEPQSWPTTIADCLAECLHHAHVVGDVLQHAVGRNVQRLRGAAVAADVDGDSTEAGSGDDRQLAAPRVPRFGKAVHEQDDRPFPFLDEVDAGAAGVDGAMPHAR